MWGLHVKFIDDAIKGSEETIEKSAPKKSNDALDEELIKIIENSRAKIIVVGAGGAGTGGGDYRCGCITVCGENTCVCLDEGGTLPSETAYSYFASNPEGENLNINTANYNYERFIMP